jgi:Mg2+ and Co2+ transporter CorA
MDIIDQVKELEKVGFRRDQAETQVKVVGKLMKDFATKENVLAVKEEVRAFKAEVKDEFQSIRTEIHIESARLEKSFTEKLGITNEILETKMENLMNQYTWKLIRWLSAIFGILSFITNFWK